MNRRPWAAAVVLVAALAPPGYSQAPLAAAPARPDDAPAAKAAGPYVVVVGVGQFADPAIRPRPSAEADARVAYDLLTDPARLGTKERSKLLLGKDVTQKAVSAALADAVAKTGKDDLVVLAFFGSGASAGDDTALFTADTVLKDRAKTSYLGSDFKADLKPLKGQRLLVLMDVTFKGFAPGDEKIAEPTMRDVIAAVFGEEKEDNALPPDRLLVLGNPPFQEPLAQNGHSLFGTTLAAALRGEADADRAYRDGYEADGVVTAGELVKYLEKRIPDLARTAGKTNKEKEQTPFFVGEGTSHFAIARDPAPAAKARQAADALAKLAKAGTVTADELKEGTALLTRMPKLKGQQELRRLYQGLVTEVADPAGKLRDFQVGRARIKAASVLPAGKATDFAGNVDGGIRTVVGRYVKEVNPGELTAAAVRGLYRRVEEPVPADIEDMLKGAKEMANPRAVLAAARLRLGAREDLDDGKDVDLALQSLLISLNDPYTTYFDKDAIRRMQSQLRGRFPGIGVQIRRDAVRDGLLVATPIKGSPAFAGGQGLHAGDLITAVVRTVDSDGKPLPLVDGKPQRTSMSGMKVDDAIKIILGQPKTPVTIEVLAGEGRQGRDQVVRHRPRLGVGRERPRVRADGADNTDWKYERDADYGIAYVT